MNRVLVVLGVVLITVGLLGLKYGVMTKEQVGTTFGNISVEVPVEREKRLPEAVAWTIAGGGYLLVGVGVILRSRET